MHVILKHTLAVFSLHHPRAFADVFSQKAKQCTRYKATHHGASPSHHGLPRQDGGEESGEARHGAYAQQREEKLPGEGEYTSRPQLHRERWNGKESVTDNVGHVLHDGDDSAEDGEIRRGGNRLRELQSCTEDCADSVPHCHAHNRALRVQKEA